MAIANRSLASLPKTRVRDLELKFALIGKQKLFDLVMFTYTGVHVPAIPRSVSKALSLERTVGMSRAAGFKSTNSTRCRSWHDLRTGITKVTEAGAEE